MALLQVTRPSLCLQLTLPTLPLSMQTGDGEAAEAALAPAWAALDAGAHKRERPGVPPFLQRFHAGR